MKMRDFRIIIRVYRDGWTHKKTAQVLGCCPSTVSKICRKKELLPYIGELKRRKSKQSGLDRMIVEMTKPEPKKQKSTSRARPKPKTPSSVIAGIIGVSPKVPFNIIDVQENDNETVITAEQKTDTIIVKHTVPISKQKKWVSSKTVPDEKNV